jgi:LytS/YehU family sensor histidine kinase
MVIFIYVVITELDFISAIFEPMFLLAGIYIPVLFAVVVKLYTGWIQSEEEKKSLQQKQAEAELKLLKSQLHPHFLFNTLNNLYALALEKSDKLPNAILELSDLLHFILYESQADKIPLEDELKQVENYVELEKLRLDENSEIKIEVQGQPQGQKILPLSVLTLVENSFKHGNTGVKEAFWINVSVSISDSNRITVVVENPFESNSEKKTGGIGLDNLKSRLELIYGRDYTLDILTDNNLHKVILDLE